MTNTLTSNIKPFQWFPKVNSNLLAVVSLIALCSMIFLLAQPVSANDCSGYEDLYNAALDWLDDAQEELEDAQEELENAEGFWETLQAQRRVAAAAIKVGLATLAVGAAWLAWQACLSSCDDSGSGGCDSGGCG